MKFYLFNFNYFIFILQKGGIRCVKINAYLEQVLGFTNVSRLAGGIVSYAREMEQKSKLLELQIKLPKDEIEMISEKRNYNYRKKDYIEMETLRANDGMLINTLDSENDDSEVTMINPSETYKSNQDAIKEKQDSFSESQDREIEKIHMTRNVAGSKFKVVVLFFVS